MTMITRFERQTTDVEHHDFVCSICGTTLEDAGRQHVHDHFSSQHPELFKYGRNRVLLMRDRPDTGYMRQRELVVVELYAEVKNGQPSYLVWYPLHRESYESAARKAVGQKMLDERYLDTGVDRVHLPCVLAELALNHLDLCSRGSSSIDEDARVLKTFVSADLDWALGLLRAKLTEEV